MIHGFVLSRDYVSVNWSETGEMLRLEVEPACATETRHMTSREHHEFNIFHWLCNTQISRDAVTKHLASCPRDYSLIRYCLPLWGCLLASSLHHGESKLQTRSCPQQQTLTVATVGKVSTGSVCNCNALSVSCRSGCVCSTPLYTGGEYSTYLILGRN